MSGCYLGRQGDGVDLVVRGVLLIAGPRELNLYLDVD